MLNRLLGVPPVLDAPLEDEDVVVLPMVPPLAALPEALLPTEELPTVDVPDAAPPAVISAPVSTLRAVTIPENGARTWAYDCRDTARCKAACAERTLASDATRLERLDATLAIAVATAARLAVTPS